MSVYMIKRTDVKRATEGDVAVIISDSREDAINTITRRRPEFKADSIEVLSMISGYSC